MGCVLVVVGVVYCYVVLVVVVGGCVGGVGFGLE